MVRRRVRGCSRPRKQTPATVPPIVTCRPGKSIELRRAATASRPYRPWRRQTPATIVTTPQIGTLGTLPTLKHRRVFATESTEDTETWTISNLRVSASRRFNLFVP